MEPALTFANAQLARMRAMNGAYHRRFFADIRFMIVIQLALFAGGIAVDPWFFAFTPWMALVGACQTAFDASYLIFSRQYATRLEQFINTSLGRDVLIAHRLEDAYLFPLDVAKVVTVPPRGPFSWFGFMTVLYTLVGVGTYGVGLGLTISVLGRRVGSGTNALYFSLLAGCTAAALLVGWWWFHGGEGERRLRSILDEAFGTL
jgi:hypothetical protein